MKELTINNMPCRQAGQSGLYLPVVGVGAGSWGRPETGDGSRVDQKTAFAVLERALELGATHWDTARGYGGPESNSERVIGEFLKQAGRGAREKVIVATKMWCPEGPNRTRLRSAVNAALERLQTDYIDLFYLHNPMTDRVYGGFITPPEETWGALDDLITEGKVHYLGISNCSAPLLRNCCDALREVRKDASRRIVAVQNRYNMLQRTELGQDQRGFEKTTREEAFIADCEYLGVGIVPFFPLGQGALTGRYRRGTWRDQAGIVTSGGAPEVWLNEKNIEVIEQLITFAEKKEITLANLAIAWLLHRPQVVSVIGGVSRPEQLEDNVKAVQVKLRREEMQDLDLILEGAATISEVITLLGDPETARQARRG